MEINKLTSENFDGKGVIGLPDSPGLSTLEMQRKFDEISIDVLAPKINEVIDGVAEHENDCTNPHGVTKTQIGLGNVDNTSDLEKPVSEAQAMMMHLMVSDVDNRFQGHLANEENPHCVTAAQIGSVTKEYVDTAIALSNGLGIPKHSDLHGRNEPEQHPIGAISGLEDFIAEQEDANGAFDQHTVNEENPHNVNILQVGGDNPNVLHNWSFLAPSNQRGESTYSGVDKYCIDRWQIDRGETAETGVLYKKSGFLTWTGNTFIQPLERLQAGTYTLSVECDSQDGGTVSLSIYVNGVYLGDVEHQVTATKSVYSQVVTIDSYLTENLHFCIKNTNRSSGLNMYRAKLEKGTVSTLVNSVDPPYGEQTVLCKRYYQVLTSGENFVIKSVKSSSNNPKHEVHFQFSPPLVTGIPTVTYRMVSGDPIYYITRNGILFSSPESFELTDIRVSVDL